MPEGMKPRLAKGSNAGVGAGSGSGSGAGSGTGPGPEPGSGAGSASVTVGTGGSSSKWGWAWRSPWSGAMRNKGAAGGPSPGVPAEGGGVGGSGGGAWAEAAQGSEHAGVGVPEALVGRLALQPSVGSRGAEFLVEAASMFAGGDEEDEREAHGDSDGAESPASQAGSFFGFTRDARMGVEEGVSSSGGAVARDGWTDGVVTGQVEMSESDESSVAPFFSAAQVDEFREAFRLLDRDGDGIIGEDDVVRVLGDLDGFEDPEAAREGLEGALLRSAAAMRNREHSPGAPQYTPRGRNPTPVHPSLSPRGFVHGSPVAAGKENRARNAVAGLYVTWEQFLTIMEEKVKSTSAEEQLREAFHVFDRNGDGTIDRSELRRLFEALSGRPIGERDVKKLLDGADLNHDGRIGFGEFRALMLEVYSH